MFTGIVEEMGAVTSLEQTLGGTRLTILASTVLAGCGAVRNTPDHVVSWDRW